MSSRLAGFWTAVFAHHDSADDRPAIEVAVGSRNPEKLLGVRDGFVRYFEATLRRPVRCVVASEPPGGSDDNSSIPLSEEEILGSALAGARALHTRLDPRFAFCVWSETGVHSLCAGEETWHFVRTFTAIASRFGEAAGGSGSQQMPPALLAGLEHGALPYAMPGTRRRGGMTASLTGGIETLRSSVAISTVHALSTLFYGVFDERAAGGGGSERRRR